MFGGFELIVEDCSERIYGDESREGKWHKKKI